MPPHILGTSPEGIPYQKLIDAIRREGDELDRRLKVMDAFMATEGFKAFQPIDQHLFVLQRETAQAYMHILVMRMARFDEARKGVLPPGVSALDKKPLIQ